MEIPSKLAPSIPAKGVMPQNLSNIVTNIHGKAAVNPPGPGLAANPQMGPPVYVFLSLCSYFSARN